MAATAVLALSACVEDSVDELTGKYAATQFEGCTAKVRPTVKLKKGVKALNVALYKEGATVAGQTDSIHLSFGSSEWILPENVYVTADEVAVKNDLSAYYFAGSDSVALSGKLNVNIVDSDYFIKGLLTDANGGRYNVDYKGALEFVVGEDDPEASGYTIAIVENAVTDANGTVYDGLTKYAITVSDPEGTAVAEFDAVNTSGLSMQDLAGTYTIQGYPTEKGLMDNGWVVYYPDWGWEMAGGTYYTDNSGVKQYVTSGQITIKAQEGIDGTMLYSFSGSDLAALTAQNVASTGGSFSILFASYVEKTGTVLKDQVISSTVMGCDMKYSIYLPQSWDGTKTFPVLYLLHGADGSNNDWLTGASIDTQVSAAIAAGTAPEMIVVMPNGTVDGKNLFYCNDYQGDAQYMTFFFDEFLPAIEAMYKVQSDREHRMIGGLSMGGYGSLYYGALHPEMFSYVYACSPATYIDGTPNLYDLYGAYYGNASVLPGITIEIGTSDYLFEMAGYFKQFLDGCGFTNDYITRDGQHDWTFWAACAPKIVAKAGEIFK